MGGLSRLQISSFHAFRNAHRGPLGVILEDDQGYFGFIGHLTGRTVRSWEDARALEDGQTAKCIFGTGFGREQPVSLRLACRDFGMCFVLFCASEGRSDITNQLDTLIADGTAPDHLYFLNYYLDYAEAKPSLKELFSMIPTLVTYYADAAHLADLVPADAANRDGALAVAALFSDIRAAGAPGILCSFRSYKRCLELLGTRTNATSVESVVREIVIRRHEALFKRAPHLFEPGPGHWREEIERIVKKRRAPRWWQFWRSFGTHAGVPPPSVRSAGPAAEPVTKTQTTRETQPAETPVGQNSRRFNISIEVPKSAILACDTLVFTKRIEQWLTQYATASGLQGHATAQLIKGSVIFSVQGFDSDSREIYEIPEVRRWFHELRRRVPYFLYYVDPDPRLSQYSFLIPMYVDYKELPGGRIGMDMGSFERFMEVALAHVGTFANRVGDDADAAQEMVLQAVRAAPSGSGPEM